MPSDFFPLALTSFGCNANHAKNVSHNPLLSSIPQNPPPTEPSPAPPTHANLCQVPFAPMSLTSTVSIT